MGYKKEYIPKGGSVGQVIVKSAAGRPVWDGVPGSTTATADTLPEGEVNKIPTIIQLTKLDGIEAGAEVTSLAKVTALDVATSEVTAAPTHWRVLVSGAFKRLTHAGWLELVKSAVGWTAQAVGWTMSGGTTSKTLTVSVDADTENIQQATTVLRGTAMLASTGVESATKVPKATGAEIAALLTAGGFSLTPAEGAASLDGIGDSATWKKTIAAVATALNGGDIAMNGKKYRIVAGTIRNTAGTWAFVEDAVHGVINLASVAGDTSKVRVTYGFTAKTILSLIAVPDDAYALAAITCGASVGNTYTDLTFYNRIIVEGYCYYDGTNWVILSFTSGKTATFDSVTTHQLTLNHASLGSASIYGVSVNSRYKDYICVINGVSNTYFYVQFFDRATGTQILTPDTNMKFWFTRTVPLCLAADPSTLTNSGSNVWIFGIFEVE